MRLKIIGLVSVVIITGVVCVALASSPDAWEEFRKDIRRKCEQKLQNVLIDPKIIVDPFGVSSAGIALCAGQSKHSKEQHIVICVYDKKSKKVELTSEIKMKDLPSYKKLLDENIQLRKQITKTQQTPAKECP